jgi:hypothetical protein
MFMFGPFEIGVVLAVIVIAAGYHFSHPKSEKDNGSGNHRLVVYGLVIVASTIILWNLVESKRATVRPGLTSRPLP